MPDGLSQAGSPMSRSLQLDPGAPEDIKRDLLVAGAWLGISHTFLEPYMTQDCGLTS